MEGAPAGLKGALAPTQEYLLQGSILETSRDILLHRLTGLCDNIETNFEKFRDHEMVFVLKASTSPQSVSFRVRRALNHPEMPWHLRYVGQPDPGDRSRHTLVRGCVDVGTSNNVVQFLKDLGFRLEYEYVSEGYLFRKGRMKVTVSKVSRLQQQGNVDPSNCDQVSSSLLVELSVVAPQGQDQVQEEMKNFAEQLKPLVQLEKVDHRRLQQQQQQQTP